MRERILLTTVRNLLLHYMLKRFTIYPSLSSSPLTWIKFTLWEYRRSSSNISDYWPSSIQTPPPPPHVENANTCSTSKCSKQRISHDRNKRIKTASSSLGSESSWCSPYNAYSNLNNRKRYCPKEMETYLALAKELPNNWQKILSGFELALSEPMWDLIVTLINS